MVGSKSVVGVGPSVALINPKYGHNVAGVLRACSCYGIKQLWWTGDRVTLDTGKGMKLPREERMKGYQDVEMVRSGDKLFDSFGQEVTPVAVELRPNSENLFDFEHPENPLYVFGPEDGSITRVDLRHCHRFVIIPSKHCLNLASAVGTVLYDRMLKRHRAGLEPVLAPHEYLAEHRGGGNENIQLLTGISQAGLGASTQQHVCQ